MVNIIYRQKCQEGKGVKNAEFFTKNGSREKRRKSLHTRSSVLARIMREIFWLDFGVLGVVKCCHTRGFARNGEFSAVPRVLLQTVAARRVLAAFLVYARARGRAVARGADTARV